MAFLLPQTTGNLDHILLNLKRDPEEVIRQEFDLERLFRGDKDRDDDFD